MGGRLLVGLGLNFVLYGVLLGTPIWVAYILIF